MSGQPPPPPSGLVYTAVIKPTLDNIMIAHTFTILFVPLLFCLFFFSTARSRCKPIFVLNVLAILLALTAGILVDYQAICTIAYPNKMVPFSVNAAIDVLGCVQSLLVDTILLMRLLSIYPFSHTAFYRWLTIVSLPTFLKLARVVNLVLLILDFAQIERSAFLSNASSAYLYLKIEWIMQLVDNTYASTFFLWRLWIGKQREGAHSAKTSTARQLRSLFYIASTSFVFPACFSLVQLLLFFLGVDMAIVNEIVFVNTSIAVFGVVFATVWAGSAQTRWNAHQREIPRGAERGDVELNSAVSTVVFAKTGKRLELEGPLDSTTFESDQDSSGLRILITRKEGSEIQ